MRSLGIVILINIWVVLHFPRQNIEKWKNAGVIFSQNNYIEAIIFWASTLFDIGSYFAKKNLAKIAFLFFSDTFSLRFHTQFFLLQISFVDHIFKAPELCLCTKNERNILKT